MSKAEKRTTESIRTTRKERERDFHNRTFSTRSRARVTELYSTFTAGRDFLLEQIRRYGANMQVLEIGCGGGRIANQLARESASMTGIDLSEVAIQQAQELAIEWGVKDCTSFFVMDAEKLVFPDNSFDLVYGTGILHHVRLEQTLSELSRVLKDDGVAIFAEPLGHNPFMNLFRKLTPKLRTVDEHPLRTADLDTLQKHFMNIDIHYFYLLSILMVLFHRFSFLSPLLGVLEKIDQLLFSFLPGLRKQAWQVVVIMSVPISNPQHRHNVTRSFDNTNMGMHKRPLDDVYPR